MICTDKTHRYETIYPGEYVPLPSMEVLLEKQHAIPGNKEQSVKVSKKEYTDCFHYDVVLPGASREEIFIEIFESKLSVIVLHPVKKYLGLVSQSCELATDLMECYIDLPGNADAEFISAEYKQGILKLCIPKSEMPFKPVTQQIVAY